uniref:Rad60/SUMO-like domain-containing protein n=1 Tax=Cyprinus carpio TaxID=7962 RepID=A0A8C1WWV0_CYPCA
MKDARTNDVISHKLLCLYILSLFSQEGVKTENNDHINLKVAGQDGSVVQFKIKRHTPLSKLMKAYCERQLEMEDEDTIDVFQQQTGGHV